MKQNSNVLVNSRHVYTNMRSSIRSETWRKMKKYRWYYFLLVFPFIHQIIFSYAPMYGITIAFKDFKMARGILGSSWIGIEHYKTIMRDPFFFRVLGNTIRLSLLNLIIAFPITIIFALLINEIANARFKKVIQTISYLPHFLSWVIIAGFIYQLLSPQSGFINVLLVKIGAIDEPIHFMIAKRWFIPIYVLSTIWQGTGWGSIIFLSAIASIDLEQYESAELDGANRFQKVVYITLPGILPTITIMLLLRIGRILNVGFDQIFNLYNPTTYEVADVISTFVYRKGLVEASYDYSTAVGLFQNLIGFALMMIANYFVNKVNEFSIV